ncbi:ribosome maturation factor RimP [Clostridium estertheticum]|uniref:Ribosome maturation factor RimP n=2 Tax=Clostridium estertheticum TaxID=238834 RepID=A0A1J0GJ20_9CLOT|nr:ribosome maturation factor RimP [Clostridium estertheticum]APC40918.1 ribosome maturation factor RimP [Clostridium estertheticum subsp. estertheticum]MBU3073976.1 ribosome maturation factor RimP [Clostridium estertheticum]MBU3164070.1 ribosome maturation factor RimP [Clostridium estertheticum]MBU3187111.1 ribosome maturation factor RimP [Clostridium estertheticum]MBW9170880.1 ribosome maturation factor RimP [Clostridium estertheticum]
MRNDTLLQKLRKIALPIVEKNNCELYHLEYVKEAGENYLRIYIDSSSGISLEDCEKTSRGISEILDVEDPITDSYCLEVSSPGIERILYDDNHLKKYIGQNVLVNLKSLYEGTKKLEGDLVGFSDAQIEIQYDGNNIIIPKENISIVSLKPVL